MLLRIIYYSIFSPKCYFLLTLSMRFIPFMLFFTISSIFCPFCYFCILLYFPPSLLFSVISATFRHLRYFPPSLLFSALSAIFCPLGYFPHSRLFSTLSAIFRPLCYFLPSLLFSAHSAIFRPLCYFPPSLLFSTLSAIFYPFCYFLPSLLFRPVLFYEGGWYFSLNFSLPRPGRRRDRILTVLDGQNYDHRHHEYYIYTFCPVFIYVICGGKLKFITCSLRDLKITWGYINLYLQEYEILRKQGSIISGVWATDKLMQWWSAVGTMNIKYKTSQAVFTLFTHFRKRTIN